MVTWWMNGNPYATTAWALLENGVAVANGDLVGGGNTHTLVAYTDTFALHDQNSGQLYLFDGVGWNAASVLPGLTVIASGGNLLALYDYIAPHTATVFDGASAGPTHTFTNWVRAAASDGAGGFAIATVTPFPGDPATIRFATNDGSGWSSESLVVEHAVGLHPVPQRLVRFGATWALLYTTWVSPPGSYDKTAHVAIRNGDGSWSTTTVPGPTSREFSLAANGPTLAVVSNTGLVALHTAGTWTTQQLTPSPGSTSTIHQPKPLVEPRGNGFAAVYGGALGPVYVASSDGDVWAEELIPGSTNYAELSIAASGNGAAVVARRAGVEPKAAILDGSVWTITPILTPAPDFYLPRLVAASDGFRAVYRQPGRIETRVALTSTFSSAEVLPQTPMPGAVFEGALTRNGNGSLLATWVQEENGLWRLLASERAGASWGAPALIGVPFSSDIDPTVVANEDTFVIATRSGSRWVAGAWSGNGLGVVSQLADPQDGTFSLGSDGTRFVAVYSDLYDPVATWSYSADGTTWSVPAVLDPDTRSATILAGGPAGVVVFTEDGARLWQEGIWSVPSEVPDGWVVPSGSPLDFSRCRGAVGTDSALVICPPWQPGSPASAIRGVLFSGGAWTTVEIPETSEQTFQGALATDGSDYRFDFFASGRSRSSLLQDGVWTIPVDNDGISAVHFVAPLCGKWYAVHGELGIDVAVATGAGAYFPDHPTMARAPYAGFAAGSNSLDALWLAPSATSNGRYVLHGQVGL